jgi:small basic protein
LFSPSIPAASTHSTPGQRLRSHKTWLPIVGFLLGFALTFSVFQDGIPFAIAQYQSLALLAGLDSVFGGIRAGAERRFRSDVFLTGFLVNMLLAVLLVAMGELIGVDGLHLAAVVTLGGRIFLNLSVIRRHYLERHPIRGEK